MRNVPIVKSALLAAAAFASASFACAPAARALDCQSGARAPAHEARSLFLLAEGDSITSGDGVTDGGGSYVGRAAIEGFTSVEIKNYAKSRATLGNPWVAPGDNSLWGRLALARSVVARKRPGTRYAVSILIGRNDLANYDSAGRYIDDLLGYAQALKEAGFDEIAVGTTLPSDWPPFIPMHHAFNDRLRSICASVPTVVDRVIDFEAIPELKGDDAARDRGLFADGTHPTDRAYGLMSRVFASTMSAR